MSYYAVDPWQNQSRQASWEHTQSSSGTSGSAGGRNEPGLAFSSQLEEVDRAVENLSRSGKLIPAGPGMGPAFRRDPMMVGGPPAPGLGPGASRGDFSGSGHHGSSQSRHHSMSEFEQRQGSHGHGAHSSGNVQGFYQNQRYGSGPSPHAGHPGTRKSDADHSHQAQRRMAAQRERELRNYHQEQQYNRAGKPERTISPNMSEEERRDLIARQHRALYGDEHNPAPFDPSKSGDVSQDSITSPQATANNSPPTGNQNSASAPRTSNTPPKDPLHTQGGSSPTRQHSKTVSAGPGVSVPVAPIGTRPTAGSISQTKRPTPPASSPLGISGTERAPSSASNPSKDNSTGSGTPNTWGSSSGVWGKNTLGVQASVWG